MPIIYRRDLDRPLTFEEMDGNLEYLNRYAEDVEVVVAHIDEISDVAASINGVNAVAGSLPSVIATSLHLDEIDTVAGDTTNIVTVAGLSSEITAVAGASTEIVAVSADLSNIDDVAGNLSDINTVAGISGSVTAVAGVYADVTTVAGIASDVSAVAAINDDILTVSFINGDVVTVANNSDNITTVATNIAGILAAQGYADDAATSAGEAAASALEAAGYLTSTEVVYEHFDARYLGAKATAPTHDNQGDPLVVGALYFDTTIGFMYSWTGTVWQSLAAAGGVDSVNGRVGDVVLTASDVGLENVTNESKATMFDDSAFTGSTTVESLQFTGGTGAQGTMSWNSDEETLDLIQDGATLQLGQELQTHCRNNTASSIPNATVVMATGTLGASGRITIAPWDGTTDIKYILGVTTEVIEAGTDGKVTTFGKVREVDTGAISGTFTTGVIYAKTDGTGGLTYTKPSSNAVPLAFLVSAESAPSANNGTIMVRVTPVSETILDHAETAYGWGNHASAGYATAANLSAHTGNTSNPHSVTATQVGLGNVTNESKATMFTSPTFTGNAVLGTPASGNFSTGTFTWPTFNQNTTGNAATATYATSAGDASTLETHSASYFATASGLSSHTSNTSNPHSVTAAQVGAYTTGSVDTLLAAKVSKTASTGSAVMPSGTTGERDGSPAAGYMRFNSSLAKFEGYNGSAWSSVGGGATGGGSDAIFIENGQTVTTDYTITSGNNAGTFGPVSVNSGVTVTIPSGSVWTIV